MTRKHAIESTVTWNKNLNIGDKIEGVFVKEETSEGQFGTSRKYVIKAKDGTMYGIYGTASLDRQFNNVPEGSYVWVEYKGEEMTKTGRPVKLFSVDYDDEYVEA